MSPDRSEKIEPITAPVGVVCYVIDSGYLLPTLVSAIQAREHTSSGVADIVIICLDEMSEKLEVAQVVANHHNIKILVRPKALMKGRHIMFGRLLLDEMLPSKYTRIVYIDGDTQVRGSLDHLFAAPLSEGQFLAVRDPVALFGKVSSKIGRDFENYRVQIGITDPLRYFNSGLLVISRRGWSKLAEKAFEIYDCNKGQFKYPDQDALNLVGSDSCGLISNRWNFPGFLIGSPADSNVKPHVYHFMSNPRPWNEAVAPWGSPWKKPYVQLLTENPGLAALKPKSSVQTQIRYIIQQMVKVQLEYRKVGVLTELPAEVDI